MGTEREQEQGSNVKKNKLTIMMFEIMKKIAEKWDENLKRTLDETLKRRHWEDKIKQWKTRKKYLRRYKIQELDK